MSTSVAIVPTVRDNLRESRLPAYSGETYYAGSYVVLDGSGYLRNFVAAVSGSIKAVFILKDSMFTDQSLGSTANPISTPGTVVASANGDLSANTNCLSVYSFGEFQATFESTVGLAVTDEGMPVYLVDNNTLTVSPKLGYHRVGTLSKYISATVGHVVFDGWQSYGEEIINFHMPLAGATSGLYNVLKTIQNPFGFSVYVRRLDISVNTASSTVTGTAFIGASSSGLAALSSGMIYTSSSIDYTRVGLNTIQYNNTYTTSGALPIPGADNAIWTSSQWLTISMSATIGTSFVGWMSYGVQRI